MNKIEELADVCDWIEGVHPDCKYDPLVSLHTVMEALESEEVVAGYVTPDFLALLQQWGQFTVWEKPIGKITRRVRILAAKGE